MKPSQMLMRHCSHAVRLKVGAAILAAMLAGGCSVGPKPYDSPSLDVPSAWREPLVRDDDRFKPQQAWWKQFHDPALDALLGRVLQANNTLAAAAATLKRARTQAQLTGTNITPDVSVSASLSNAKSLRVESSSTRTSSTSASASYEIDIWGRLARLREVSDLEADATEYDRRAAALTLVGTAARLYWQIGELNGLIDITNAQIANARNTVDIVNSQFSVGSANSVALEQARGTYEGLQADLTVLISQVEASRNALAILSNQSPAHREPELAGLQPMPDTGLPPALPADMLARRPDLQAAELRLRESLASAEASRLAFYPTFSLTGSLTAGGVSAGDLLKDPARTIGGALSLPFLQWNVARLTSQVSRESFNIALINFRQTFYQALSDAQSAITASRQSSQEVVRRVAALEANRNAQVIAERRFRAGRTSAKEWLDAQQTAHLSALQLQQSIYTQYSNELTLFLALGGDPWAQTVRPSGSWSRFEPPSR